MTTVSCFSILRIYYRMQSVSQFTEVNSAFISILRIPCGMRLSSNLRIAYFNLTHPLRDATEQMRPRKKQTAISILRIPCWMQRTRKNFNLTHPLLDATARRLSAKLCRRCFNLTHPLRDATAILYITRIIFLCVIVHFY